METRGRFYFVMCGMVLMAASVFVSGCIPISIPLDLTVAQDQTLSLGDLQPGAAIPAGNFEPVPPFCQTLPTFDDLRALISQAVGFLSGLLQIQSVEPSSIILTATSGSFSSIQNIEVTLVLPDNSTVAVDAQLNADGTQLTLTPESTLDLVALLNEFGGQNGCVTLELTASGTAPDPAPEFSVEVKGTVVVLI